VILEDKSLTGEISNKIRLLDLSEKATDGFAKAYMWTTSLTALVSAEADFRN